MSFGEQYSRGKNLLKLILTMPEILRGSHCLVIVTMCLNHVLSFCMKTEDFTPKPHSENLTTMLQDCGKTKLSLGNQHGHPL